MQDMIGKARTNKKCIAGCQLIGIGARRPHEEKALLPAKYSNPWTVAVCLCSCPAPSPSGSVFLLRLAGKWIQGHYGEPGMDWPGDSKMCICQHLPALRCDGEGVFFLLQGVYLSLSLSDSTTVNQLHCTIIQVQDSWSRRRGTCACSCHDIKWHFAATILGTQY